jgi:hypothetical protein
MFKTGVQSYLKIMTTWMKWSTLQQHKEVEMLCEENMTTIEARSALLVLEYQRCNTNENTK